MKLNHMKIQLALAKNCIDVKELARRYGCKDRNIYSILGRKTVYPATAGKLARALNVDVSEIIEEGG